MLLGEAEEDAVLWSLHEALMRGELVVAFWKRRILGGCIT